MINWQPLMTESEAEIYTRNSYYSGRNFYHGTSKLAADSIITSGILLSTDRVNTYGEGFYFAFSRSDAVKYAIVNKSPAVITARVNVKSPKKFKDILQTAKY